MDGCGLTTGNTGLDALVLALMPLITLLVQWLSGKTPEPEKKPTPTPSDNGDGKTGPL
jgi:hypothetical protein